MNSCVNYCILTINVCRLKVNSIPTNINSLFGNIYPSVTIAIKIVQFPRRYGFRT